MRIAWFTHRYHPCIGGAENYGRAMVQRFVAAGYEAEVVTSDADDLWYFTNRRRRRLDAPRVSIVDGARGRSAADLDPVPPPGHARRPLPQTLHPPAPDPPVKRVGLRRRPDWPGSRCCGRMGHRAFEDPDAGHGGRARRRDGRGSPG